MNQRPLHLIYFGIFICTTTTLRAQNDWRPGFVIQHTGDTLHGFVDFRTPKSNSEQCYFRLSEKGETKIYSPAEIHSYRYADSKYYVAKRIPPDSTLCFLEFLVNGMTDLYLLADKKERFFVEKDGKTYELKNTEEMTYKGNTQAILEKKEYRGTLSYLWQDGNMSSDIISSKLDQQTLIKLSKKYHSRTCDTGEACITFEKHVRTQVAYGVLYGTNGSTLRLFPSLNYDILNERSRFFGAVFNFQNIPGLYERIGFQVEILANEFDMNRKRKHMLNIPIMVTYRLTSSRIYPQIDLGASSYFTKVDQFNLYGYERYKNVQQFTGFAGISIHGQLWGGINLFMHSRMELDPRVFRFGAGVLF